MVHELFLAERVFQIQRLHAADSSNRIEIPSRMSRSGYSSSAVHLFRQVERICKIPVAEDGSRLPAWLRDQRDRWLRLANRGDAAGDEHTMLSSKHQALVLDFEKLVVQLFFSDDRSASAVASQIISAILQDYQNFIGYKPVQFHTEDVAYEFLFPSWLNLYAAFVFPCANGNGERFSEAQISTVFSFLDEYERQRGSCDELLGTLTFAANRLPLANAERVVQRLIDLACCDTADFDDVIAGNIARVGERLEGSAELLSALHGLLVCAWCQFRQDITPMYEVVSERLRSDDFPQLLATKTEAIPESNDDFQAWVELVARAGRIFDHVGCLDGEFTNLLEKRPNAHVWLSLVSQDENSAPLPRVPQRVLARMIRRSSATKGDASANTFRGFARHIAPRLDALDASVVAAFEADFVQQDQNREFLLRNVDSHDRRREMSRRISTLCLKTKDGTRFLSRLSIAAMIDPDCDDEKFRKIGRTGRILSRARKEGFITDRQHDELISDLRQRLPDSVEFLATPRLGASNASDRLAKLYLALNEECEAYDHSGKIGNFGLTLAGYSNLARDIDARDL